MNIEELLPAYAAGELSGEERENVEAELRRSPGMRRELDRYEKLFVLLAAAAEEEEHAPAALAGRVRRQVAMEAYLRAAASTVESLLGAYGRAVIYYLGLA